MNLDLGSGHYPIESPGYVHIDGYAYPGVDCLGDALRLPFRDNAFSGVVASHIIEHIPWLVVSQYLDEWYRVLQPGGCLEVQTFDFIALARHYLSGVPLDRSRLNPDGLRGRWLNQVIFWWEEDPARPENPHKAIYDFPYLAYCLDQASFVRVRWLDMEETKTYSHGKMDMLVRGWK